MLLMFEVEKAHWFYLDHWRERDSSLPSLGMRDFAIKIFAHTAFLQGYVNGFDTIFTNWQEYKRGVPTFGAIILNTNLTKVVMVQGWGGKSWGWPKGKLNKDESDAVCAAREVYEEIGFDVTPYVDEENELTAKMHGQHMKLFIIPGISEETVFETLTRQEIKDIKWHEIADLQVKIKDDSKKNKYYNVTPVLGRLSSWIREYKRSLSRSRTPPRVNCAAAALVTASPAAAKREKKVKQGASYSLVQQETDAAGVSRDNSTTFGATFKETAAKGFSADEMFRINAELFNIHSTYSFDQYTTALPGQKERGESKIGVHAPERYRACQVQDVQSKIADDAVKIVESKAQEPRSTRKVKKESKANVPECEPNVLLSFSFDLADRKAIVDSMGF